MELTNYITDSFGYESITVGTLAIGFTAGSITPTSAPPARIVSVSIESAVDGSIPTMRYRYDGTDPTSSEGHLADTGDLLALYGINNLRNFRAIRTGSISCIMKVTYGR